ncbi:MAG: hypothetical protein KDE14_09095 [Rhodobacteraceae bacterium]|nr:hypothetical protein [Paracoccaceae bacterium]
MKNKNITDEPVIHAPFIDMRGWPTEVAATILVAGAAFTLLVGFAGHADAADFRAEPASVEIAAGNGDAYIKTPIIGVEAGRSLIRFANLDDTVTATNYVEIYGLGSQATLGSFQVDVPPKASIEVRPEQMIQTFAPVDYDQPLVLYVENGRAKQLYQHVIYDAEQGSFANASACTTAPHVDYVPDGQSAINVLAGVGRYASFVTVHNFTDVPAVFEARVYDAADGRMKGSVEIELGARESFSQSGLWYQQATGGIVIGIGKASQQDQINIEYAPAGPDSAARLVVAHEIYDLYRGSSTNVSNPCPIHGGIIDLDDPVDAESKI